jgi:C-terminal processing protease CtpA/Prc
MQEFMVVAEVLHGLGLAEEGRATFTLDGVGDVTLTPVPQGEWAGGVGRGNPELPRGPKPLYRARADRRWWTATYNRGSVVYAAYNETHGGYEIARRIRQLAAKKSFRKLILDLRLNGGGDNTSYGELVSLARTPRFNKPGRLVVLIGRMTFSAAGNLATDLDTSTRAVFVGEPTGGSRNQYGDAQHVELAESGWTFLLATSFQEYDPGTGAAPVRPDVAVEPTVADFLAGRDPVLEAALRR